MAMALMASRPLLCGVQKSAADSSPHCSFSSYSTAQYNNRTRAKAARSLSGEFASSNSLRSVLLITRKRPQRCTRLNVTASADYYSILGVSKSASKSEIKSAYRKLARQFHPDVNKEPEAEAKFKEISNAYEVLSDDEKRPIYDQYGEAGLKGAAAGGAGFSNPFDLFETFFGGMGGGGMGGGRGARNRPVQGADEQYELRVAFLEACFGATKEIEIARLETCGKCEGTGVKAGTSAKSCAKCGGQGQVVTTARTPLGDFRQISTCPACGGAGEVSTPCAACRGDGRERKKKSISLKVPAGVDSGSRLRVRSEGNSGKRGGPPGDLYVFISVQPHPSLTRDGQSVLATCRISYLDAILGACKIVPTIDGDSELRIPPGTQPGSTLVLPKKGVPVLGKPNLRGDHLVRVDVDIPKLLSPEERKLIHQLSDLRNVKAANNAR